MNTTTVKVNARGKSWGDRLVFRGGYLSARTEKTSDGYDLYSVAVDGSEYLAGTYDTLAEALRKA